MFAADERMPAVLDAPELYGPFQYWPWWLLGAAILLTLLASVLLVLALTRPRGILEPPPPPPPQVDVRTLKQKYLDMIEEVAAQASSGELSARELAQRLSLVLRFFAHESTGVRAEVMTLDDLRGAELPAVEHAVGNYYPASFMRVARQDQGDAVELAKRVVATWM